MQGETHIVNAFMERVWEMLREAPMPYHESVLDMDEWLERYGEWWHKYASEDSIKQQQVKMEMMKGSMMKTERLGR